MKTIKLENSKTHRYKVDARFLSLHTTATLTFGQTLDYNGLELKVKEVIKNQASRYYKKYNYYEIRV